MDTEDLFEFLELFPPNSLHYSQIEYTDFITWVFWSQNEGSENETCSADLGTPMIHDKIKSAFLKLKTEYYQLWELCQFWAPVTTGGRQLLSTSGQPFVIFSLKYGAKEKAKYRLYTEEYKYNIDMTKVGIEGDHTIINGGPATAFLNRLPYIYQREDSDDKEFDLSFFIPFCYPSQRSCIGVLEFAFSSENGPLLSISKTISAVKEAGLDVIHVQDLIPYKTINGLELAKGEIEEALKVICESHNLALAQVSIAYEDKNHVLSSSPLEDTQTNRLLAIKLTGYLYAKENNGIDDFSDYFSMCDVILRGLASDEFPVLETLQDHGSRYISVLHSNKLVSWDPEFFNLTSAFAICLRSNNTDNFNYAFEFIWTKQSNYVNYLEAIILTLKRCLPSYKFASGIELGDELDVIVAQNDTQSDTESEDDKIGEAETFKIFKGKRSTPISKPTEEGTEAKVGDYIAPSRVVCKTAPKVLTLKAIEEQCGKTMKKAAENLKVSETTLKRKVRKLQIPVWPGPKYEKKKANNLSIDQINSTKEDNEAIREPSAIKLDQDTLTIKAELGEDMIKFPIHISQATFLTLAEQIGNRFDGLRTFKLKYRDEAGDWILLRSDEELSYCIESSRKMETNEVRLRVLPFT